MKREGLARFTYFIQRGDAGPIKIGVAKDVQRRIAGLATANAEPLRLLATLEGDFEFVLHRRHSADRLCGEWFSPSEAVLAEVARAKAKERAAPKKTARDASLRGQWVPRREPTPKNSLAHMIGQACILRALRGVT